jgi:hypothetical protein
MELSKFDNTGGFEIWDYEILYEMDDLSECRAEKKRLIAESVPSLNREKKEQDKWSKLRRYRHFKNIRDNV